jgi:hypothetical protein
MLKFAWGDIAGFLRGEPIEGQFLHRLIMQPGMTIARSTTLFDWKFLENLIMASKGLHKPGKPIALAFMPLASNFNAHLSPTKALQPKGGKIRDDQELVEL